MKIFFFLLVVSVCEVMADTKKTLHCDGWISQQFFGAGSSYSKVYKANIKPFEISAFESRAIDLSLLEQDFFSSNQKSWVGSDLAGARLEVSMNGVVDNNGNQYYPFLASHLTIFPFGESTPMTFTSLDRTSLEFSKIEQPLEAYSVVELPPRQEKARSEIRLAVTCRRSTQQIE